MKETKTKSKNIVLNDINIFLKMENKGQFGIEKIILKCEKIKAD